MITKQRAREHDERLQEAVLCDNAERLEREYPFSAVDACVGRHVLHVMAHCPKVLTHWLKSMQGYGPPGLHRLYRYAGQALEPLDDVDKIRLLEGKVDHAAHMDLHRFLRERPDHWALVSPAWIGQHNSALRRAAESVGWHPRQLPKMIQVGLHHSSTNGWLAQVPYAYSILMLNAIDEVQRMNVSTDLRSCVYLGKPVTGSTHANPMDVALAGLLAADGNMRLAQVVDIEHWRGAVETHQYERLQALVQCYGGLGLMGDLMDSLQRGVLPGVGERAQLALPDLDGCAP